MMEASTLHPGGKIAHIAFAIIFLLIFSAPQPLSAQPQVSTFTIPGWIPGTSPVFSGSGSNVISLSYGDNLSTAVAFSGSPDDGMGVDESNFAFMGFSYTYTVYLTAIGDTFSTSSSIPIGTHTVSAYQTCTSGIVPPWSIGYDMQPAVDTNNLTMTIADMINECVTPGNYQIDILLDSYAQNTAGPSPGIIQLQWYGYANNNMVGGPTALSAPSDTNTSGMSLNPVSSYLLGRMAFVHIDKPVSCPPLTLALTENSQSPLSSATVVATYPGQCPRNNLLYLWSTGDTTSTISGLSRGSYSVTVTAPCGNSASASLMVSGISAPKVPILTASATYDDDLHALRLARPLLAAANNGNNAANEDKKYKSAPDNGATEAITQAPYPNPAKHHITFDLGGGPDTHAAIRIYDILGNEVMAPVTGASERVEVSLDGLPPGVYLYELAAHQTLRGKFIKE